MSRANFQDQDGPVTGKISDPAPPMSAAELFNKHFNAANKWTVRTICFSSVSFDEYKKLCAAALNQKTTDDYQITDISYDILTCKLILVDKTKIK